MRFVSPIRLWDGTCDEFVRRHQLENHFGRNCFIRACVESINRIFADAEKNHLVLSISLQHVTHNISATTEIFLTRCICYWNGCTIFYETGVSVSQRAYETKIISEISAASGPKCESENACVNYKSLFLHRISLFSTSSICTETKI